MLRSLSERPDNSGLYEYQDAKNEDTYVIGKIVKCSGIRGYVKVHLYSQYVGLVKKGSRFSLGESGRLRKAGATYRVDNFSIKGNVVLVKFSGIDDRTAAEEIVNKYLLTRERAPRAKGSFLIREIIGCEVWSTDGRLLGTVSDVLPRNSGLAHDVWEIQCGQRRNLIPAVKEFIREVDTSGRKIVVNVIDGLVEG